MGRAMADLLVRAVDGDAAGPTSVVLPTTLVRRGSA
jgi:DNA-binding LacI/PurR family transcriptional regulator